MLSAPKQLAERLEKIKASKFLQIFWPLHRFYHRAGLDVGLLTPIRLPGLSHGSSINAMLSVGPGIVASAQVMLLVLSKSYTTMRSFHPGFTLIVIVPTLTAFLLMSLQSSAAQSDELIRPVHAKHRHHTRSHGWRPSPPPSYPSMAAARKATIWEAPSNYENECKAALEQSQIQNGLTHPLTMQAMWNLGQYYVSAQKYSEADSVLSDLLTVCKQNQSNAPFPLSQVSSAYTKVKAELRKEQYATPSRHKLPGSHGSHKSGPHHGLYPKLAPAPLPTTQEKI